MKLAYFFVPLIEPLGLPDGFVFEFTRSETYEEWLERERQGRCGPSDEQGPILVASLKFWRATTLTNDPGGGRTLFEVARRAFPDVPAPSGTPTPWDGDRTVVEMAVPLPDEGDDPLTEAFEVGLGNLRTFQRAYHVVGGKYPMTLASRERMPIGVPSAVRDTDGANGGWPSELSLFLLNSNVHTDTRLPELTEQQLDSLSSAAVGVANEGVFHGYAEGAREAQVALQRDGDYRAAILFASMATEVLLDDLLAHVMWEDAARPEDAAACFDAGFLVTRVKREYQRRLGGSWALTGRGAIADWSETLAKVRNRIIHAGFEPNRAAAFAAWTALTGLESFLTDRLASPGVLTRYPRTALGLMGVPGIQRRGKWSRRLQTLIDSRDEPPWAETFARWRAAMHRCRAEGREMAEAPDRNRAFVLRCLLPNGGAYWCAHDRVAEMAGVLPEPPVGAIGAQQRRNIDNSEQALQSETFEEAISMALMDVRPWAEPSEWRLEYRVMPLAGVMVNKQDLDTDLTAV